MTDAQEIHCLLSFFARPQAEQWRLVPDEMETVWFRDGNSDCPTAEPIRVLALSLVGRLDGCPPVYDDETLEILAELRVLLDWWMLESVRDEVFTKRAETDELDRIWRTVARVCEAALARESVQRHRCEGFSFAYFYEKNTRPVRTTGDATRRNDDSSD
jgi:hypothetical protein